MKISNFSKKSKFSVGPKVKNIFTTVSDFEKNCIFGEISSRASSLLLGSCFDSARLARTGPVLGPRKKAVGVLVKIPKAVGVLVKILKAVGA